MAKKNINHLKSEEEILKSMREDWGGVKPYTRVFDDERKRLEREKKHKKSLNDYQAEAEAELDGEEND